MDVVTMTRCSDPQAAMKKGDDGQREGVADFSSKK